jgi:hypothetical protein
MVCFRYITVNTQHKGDNKKKKNNNKHGGSNKNTHIGQASLCNYSSSFMFSNFKNIHKSVISDLVTSFLVKP